MPKNIVICCDGTGNQFDESKSNVIKVYKTLICDDNQIAYYHPGVGTMGSRNALSRIGKLWTKVIGLAFGYGISDNVADAYQFLMRTYETGDKVYVFGFSRGAYTARALCGMLRIVGLLTRGNEGLIPYAIRMMKAKPINFRVAEDFKHTFSRVCKPHFVGVWDTVSSVGWVYNAVTFPYTRATSNEDLNIVRHAVSIDERRAFFPSNSFGQPSPKNPLQDVMEVLFAGVHSDVGGSYPEKESQLSQIALRWMLGEAEAAGLRIDPARKEHVLGAGGEYATPDPETVHQHESLHGAWWIAELWPKVVHVPAESGEWKRRIRINLGRHRKFPPNPLVHESVEQRLSGTAYPYHPKNLPEQRRIVRDRPSGQTAAAPSRKQ
jgi:uncharacterized protein (DUF2235 family)